MKKIYFLFITCYLISIVGMKAQAFSIASPSGNYTLNCNITGIIMTTNSGATPYSYTWTAPGNTLYGNYVNISVPGAWTVTGKDLNTSITSQQTFTIFQNLQSPTVVVTPTIMNINCTTSPGYFTITSNLGPNVTTNWFTVMNSNTVYVGIAGGTINIFSPGQPGVYWGESVNNLTGCKSTKSVQVTASVGVPVFTVTSPTNFTLGCGSTSCTSMQIPFVITSPVASAPCQYTYVPPATSGTPTTFTINPNLNPVCIPGTWVVYVRDLTSNCISSQSISVIQNTIAPSVYYIQPFSPLTCSNTGMVLTGMSNNPNTTVTWTVPPTSSVVSGQTVQVNINPSIPSSSVAITSIGFHTLGIIDNNNQCHSTYNFQIFQDIRKPVFSITALTNSVITCINPSVTLVPIMTPTIAVALVPTYTWFAPVSSGVPGTSFTSTLAGTHTAIAMSSVNGCTSSATHIVAVDNVPPIASGGTFSLTCPLPATVMLFPTLGSNSVGLTYSWSPPSGAFTSVLTGQMLTTNMAGNYTCAITNSVTGCSSTVIVSVVCVTGLPGRNLNEIMISVYPNPSKGNLHIELSALEPNIKFSVFDLQGKMILERPISSNKYILETGLPKGCYFYKITSRNNMLKRDKLIIE